MTTTTSTWTRRELEKYSSAITLGDMEIFIFPELLYSLVLANIMSPRLWAWREDPWFRKIDKMNPYRRVLRLKQYIIDHYEFNLDLDTWGLTTKEKELERFEGIIDAETLSRSNALFGYEGDKYYFDLDIRKHFGLDKYTDNVIPYWKTETLEAMDAFSRMPGYRVGAGECVSLATLYAAALFVVCKIPLQDIFLMATPLHSQNFIDVREGVLTNNRRVVTKNMWFNGSELTAKAQRGLRNEQVTIVSHHTGYIHCLYPEATMNETDYGRFKDRLTDYLRTPIDMSILCNFLRYNSKLQKCFQVRHDYHGKPRYIPAEKVYAYEHNSPYKVNDKTRDNLLAEIDEFEFYTEPIENRIPLNKFDDFFAGQTIDLHNEEDLHKLMEEFKCYRTNACDIARDLMAFTELHPNLSDDGKIFADSHPIQLEVDMDRQSVLDYLAGIRLDHPVADLAFYAYRDLSVCDWEPFKTAAIERNPASIEATKELSDEEVLARVRDLAPHSIYDGPRVAQPDETWNYQAGDGLEKAFLLANIWKSRYPNEEIRLTCQAPAVYLTMLDSTVEFETAKNLQAIVAL